MSRRQLELDDLSNGLLLYSGSRTFELRSCLSSWDLFRADDRAVQLIGLQSMSKRHVL